MNKTINYLKTILDENSVVVVGTSGGPDSMCLLHLLCDLKNELNFKIVVAHMNHKVRKEADEEAEYVEKFSKENNLIYEYYELKEHIKSNFHSKSRIIRYKFFNEVIKKYSATHLMTAHHSDDLIETILIRIGRGSNLKGYSGFDLLTDKGAYKQVKPLMFYTKKDIQEYMDKNNYKYFIDKTNNDDDFLRNRYRHHVLPELYKESPNINEKYIKFSNTLLEADNFIKKYVNNIINDIYKDNILDINKYLKEDNIIQDRILEYILDTLYDDDLYKVSDSNKKEINKIIHSSKKDLFIKLPNNHIIRKEYDKLLVDKKEVINNKVIKDLYYEDDDYIISRVDKTSDSSNYTIKLNSNELNMPLVFDYRKNGDKMFIKNSKGYKKIKDIFIDLKIPSHKRDSIILLKDGLGEVLWIPAYKKSKYDKKLEEEYDLILTMIKKNNTNK